MRVPRVRCAIALDRLVVLAGLAALAAPAPAQASFPGTPGKVAYSSGIEATLKLWDPATAATDPSDPQAGVTTIEQSTYRLPEEEHLSLGFPGAPSWSPDGTRLAYTKSIDGTGNSPKPISHTAIFVYDIRDGQTTQVTHPAATLVVDPETGVGHSVSDTSPAWSSDGNRIAFVRHVAATDVDDLADDNGFNLWTVGAGGGGETRHTSFAPESGIALMGGLAWIPGTQELLAGLMDQSGAKLVRIGLGGGYSTISETSVGMLDFDVSPDGNRFTYAQTAGGPPTVYEGSLASGAAVEVDGPASAFARYSNGGEALLYKGQSADQPGVSGLLQHVVDPELNDPGPVNDRVVLPWRDSNGVIGGGGPVARMAFDIQPQTLPILFVPGFLGSQISCGGDELWPDMPFPALTGMNLTNDGNGNLNCPAAGPTGALVETVLGSDVYKSTADWLRGAFEPSRLTLFGWDWRKAPQASFERLDQAITDALERPGPWKEQRAGRVALYGHSYGGLLIRSFIEGPGGARVGRVLTAGSPYWGSPKAIFPLAFGIESPLFSPMDALIRNANMRSLAANLAGLYHLYPSDRFGHWLTVNGAARDQAGVLSFVAALGGNSGLLGQAFANHSAVIDGFYNREGFIDVRAIAGSGLPTIASFNLTGGAQDDVLVDGIFANGDSTVPLKSADQIEGSASSLGDPVALQYTCNVSHVPLPGAARVRDAYEDFLDVGRPAKRLETTPCAAEGGVYSFSSSTIGRVEPGRAQLRARRATTPLGFDAAEAAGLVDVVDAEPRTLVVVDNDLPVTLTAQITDGTFRYTPLDDGTAGTTLEYGPLTGTLQLDPSPAGGAPVVTLDGLPVPGRPIGTPPPPPPPPPPAVGGAPTGGTPPPEGSTQPPATTRSKAFAFVGRPALKGRRLRLRAHFPSSGRLRAVVTHRGRRLGRLDARVRAAGDRTFTIRLKSRPRGSVKLALSFGGKVLKATVRPRG